MNEKQYVGDVNIEYGGSFYDMSTFDDEYVEAVQVTDLDGACGFSGAIMIEHLVILLDKHHWKSALDCCGITVDELLKMDPDHRRLALVECLLSYGAYDPDDSWDGYTSSYMEVIQTREDCPMQFDEWKANKRVLSDALQGYIEAVHLNM